MEEKSERIWVVFIASPDEHPLDEIARRRNGKISNYRIDAIIPVIGKVPPGLATNWGALRIESDVPIEFPEEFQSGVKDRIITFRGVTENLHYTSDAQRLELDLRSHTEFKPSNVTTAVLIPIGKSQKWWRLPQDQRQSHFQTSADQPGHIAIGIRYVDRVFRQLYHSRYMSSQVPYDFLTYFEFDNTRQDDFRTLLGELRDTTRNPEWAYINLEYEIWMTKIEHW